MRQRRGEKQKKKVWGREREGDGEGRMVDMRKGRHGYKASRAGEDSPVH